MSDATQTDACVMTHGTFCWNELMTRDAAKAKTFLTKLLGWTAVEMDMGPMGTYTMFMDGDTQKAGMSEMNGPEFEGAPPHWMSFINVDDIEASTAKAEKLGATIHVPPSEIPGIGRFSMIEDPTGAKVGLFQTG